jgi:SAM-dependent methyltransferase
MIDQSRSLPDGFLRTLQALGESYLRETDPIRQSGFGGGRERWRQERGIIVTALEGDGDFLDVGCANGYLLECLVAWAQEWGILLTPYGVDISANLIGRARERLPRYAGNFWAANAWDWTPPRRFRYVYSLHDSVPEDFLAEYVERLLNRYVETGGRLIVGAYGSHSKNLPARDVGSDLAALGFLIEGARSCGSLPASRIAWMRAR